MPPDGAARLSRFLIRQPLLDAHYRVAGYELSLRDRVPVEVLPGTTDLGQARDEHLIASVVDLEYQHALAGRLTLLDLEPATLDNPMLSLLPSGKVAVALPASTPGLAARADALAGMGLMPVLDDDDALPAALPASCDTIRLDVGRHDAMTLRERVGHFRRLGGKRLIARNIASEEAFEVCRKLAFDQYQGDFLGQRRGGPVRKLDGGVMEIMELLNLAREQAPVARMEAVFKRNAALTYKLLRYINSPANGLGRAMQSIGQALVWLGYEPLYRWLSLLLFSTGRGGDGRDEALLRNALVRARFMENLGTLQLAANQRGGLFIVGILSHLDALLDLPMNAALEPLHLPDSMRQALLESEGIYGPYLRLARACEHFDQEVVQGLAAAHGLNADEVNLAHVEALIWSEKLEK